MLRRSFLFSATALALQKPREETFTATATQDKTPRVGIVLSTFKGGQEHDGTAISGLKDPQPLNAKLTATQYEDMVSLAINLASPRTGGLRKFFDPEDWVVILAPPQVDPVALEAVPAFLAAQKLGTRFTLTSPAAPAAVQSLKKRFPQADFDALDLANAPLLDVPPVKVPKPVRECDKLLSLAPIQAPRLSIGNYEKLPGSPGAALLDLFSVHPADFAVLYHPHLVIAGASALAVDAIGSAIRDAKPLPHFIPAEKRGYGISDPDSIWTRGNEIDEAKAALTAV
jgi:hypothetical protein